jgi:hypothetical protein
MLSIKAYVLFVHASGLTLLNLVWIMIMCRGKFADSSASTVIIGWLVVTATLILCNGLLLISVRLLVDG